MRITAITPMTCDSGVGGREAVTELLVGVRGFEQTVAIAGC